MILIIAQGKFEGHLYFQVAACRWSAGKTCEDAVRAAVEEHYLPTVPVPVNRMEMFYKLAAESDRELLKLPIRGYAQANLASRQQRRKWIGAASFEWEKIQGGIPLYKMYILDTEEKNDPRDTNRFFLSQTQRRSIQWKSLDLYQHRLWGPAVRSQRRPGRNRKGQTHESQMGLRTARWDRLSVSPLRYIAAGPRFTFRGTEGSCAQISPNCQNKMEFHVGVLAP